VLRDRQKLAEEGVVVVVVTVDIQTGKVLVGPEIITRGWVYAPEAEDLLDEACDTIADAVEASLGKGYATSRRSSATCVAPPASSSASAPSGGR
jgi:ribonuclease J